MRRRLFFLWVTFSMMLCVLVFLPWFLPRETFCGLLGRWKATEAGWKKAVGHAGVAFFDWCLHCDEEDCVTIFRMEEEARRLLYVRGELDT